MESGPTKKRVLVVANKTAADPQLLDAVRARAQHGDCTFTLLIPRPTHGFHRVVDPEDQGMNEAQTVINKALPLLEEAAGDRVEYLIGDATPLTAVQDAVNLYGFDEIILSTLPVHLSHWLKLDLANKLTGLGLPLTTIFTTERAAAA